MTSLPKGRLTLSQSPFAKAVTIRRLKQRRREEPFIEIDLSPLIDCVFLLLIFFLVTTMLKKLEKQIPVVLPDYTTALSSVVEEAKVIYALDSEGNVLRANQRRGVDGLEYRPLKDFDADLQSVAAEQGKGVGIRIDTEREVPVQKVIDLLDTLSLQGFENVGVRLRHREREFFELK